MRLALLLAAAALAGAGCASTEGTTQGGGDYGLPLDPMDATPRTTADTSSGFFESAGETILAVPETVLWWPYKVVSGALRGGYDGVADGIGDAPMPAVGVVASPVTGALGILKGIGKGLSQGPAIVRSSGEFGRALGAPWR